MGSIGNRIGDYRRKRGITQEQLAEKMGVTAQAVSKWENDGSCPDISILPQLADYFGVSLDMLIRGETPYRVQMRGENQKSVQDMALRITVITADGDLIKLNLPLPLIKAGIDLGMPLKMVNINDSSSIGDAFKQIDFSMIVELIESGMMGNLLEVVTAGGDSIAIYVD